MTEESMIRGRWWRAIVEQKDGRSPSARIECHKVADDAPAGYCVAMIVYESFDDLYFDATSMQRAGQIEVGDLMMRACDALFVAMRDRAGVSG